LPRICELNAHIKTNHVLAFMKLLRNGEPNKNRV